MRSHIDTLLVQEALQMALGRRQPSAGFRHHADRGSQYASHAYQDVLATGGIVGSMREKGACLDHAVAERFLGSVQQEGTAHCHDATRQEARDDIIADIEMFYNSKRKPAYLGYVSPNAYEKCALVAELSVRFYWTSPPHQAKSQGQSANASRRGQCDALCSAGLDKLPSNRYIYPITEPSEGLSLEG